jgi:hypothetical protein
MANDGTGTNWDITSPANADPVKDGAREIRDLRIGVAARLDKEHVETDISGAGGEHLNGSAKAYYASAAPTKRPDTTTNLDGSTDAGRLWIDSDDGLLKYGANVAGTFVWSSLIVSNVVDGAITYAKLNTAIITGLALELALPTDTNRPWLSLDGTARPYYGNYNGGAPTKRPDGVTNLNDNDSGRLAVNWNSGMGLAVYTGTAGGWISAGAVPLDLSVSPVKLTAATLALIGNNKTAHGSYTGNGTTTKAVTGVGFKPDIVVIMDRSSGNTSIAIAAFSTDINMVNSGFLGAGTFSFDSDGFTIKTTNSSVNTNGRGYAYACFKSNT